MQNMKILASLSPKISSIMRNHVNDLYNDLKSRSRSVVYIIDTCLGVRDKHTILEHPSFNISGYIMEKPKFSQ
jgi:hypothetical protein